MKVIHTKNLPARLPIVPMVVCWLALDHWNAPQWLYGVFAALFGIVVIAFFISKHKEEDVDIFKDKNV